MGFPALNQNQFLEFQNFTQSNLLFETKKINVSNTTHF